MKLYDFPFAPSPRKVGIFVAEKGIEIPTGVIDLRERQQHSPEFLKLNPSGTVPALELDSGVVLTESLAICHYLEGLYPEPNLMGGDALEQALVLMWNDILTLEGYLAIQEVLRNESEVFAGRPLPGTVTYAQIPELAERGRRRCEVFFDRLEAELAQRDHLVSDRFTYADIVAYVYTGFAERGLGASPVETRPHLKAWYRRIGERPAIAQHP
jgi:glutathione S-transferase